jgi:hypothetical protein
VHEEPEVAATIPVQLDKVISPTQSAEVSRHETQLLVLKRICRQACFYQCIRDRPWTPSVYSVPDGNAGRHCREEPRPVASRQPACREVEMKREHAAPKVASQRRRNDDILGGENRADGDAMRDVKVRHSAHSPHDVWL